MTDRPDVSDLYRLGGPGAIQRMIQGATPMTPPLTPLAPPDPLPPRLTQPRAPLGYAPLLSTIDGEDAEARYHATLALCCHDSRVVKARLHELSRVQR